LPNVTLTPHIAGYFDEYKDHVLPIVIENMERFLAGRFSEMRNVIARK
jgi:D-2-hydroxyacid dehydrogenase (NADP+)